MNRYPLKKEVLAYTQVEQLLAMRETQKALKDRLSVMDKAIEDIETQIITMVESGINLSQSGYLISIQEVSRRYPAWKEEFISKLGKAEADAILNSTKPVIYKKILIQ